MRPPSIGQAIGLQGRDQNAERLGNLIYQQAETEANRNVKRAIVKGKQDQEDEEKALKKFELPSGAFHRLVLPGVQKTQTEYLAKLKNLKLERPNDWQNGVNDLSAEYEQKMSLATTRSKDLNQYDALTASQDKGNSYFTKNWDKFNRSYETATDYDDFLSKLEKNGFTPDAQIQLRPTGSVSYTPFRNTKPKETLEQNITQAVTQLPFKSNEKSKAYGYIQGKEVKVRPVTYRKSPLGVSVEEVAAYTKLDPNEIPSIEAVVDNFLIGPDGGQESIIQYADQNNLQARFDEQGRLLPEDYASIKSNIMGWAKNFASPTITSSMMRPQTILQGQNEETSSNTADLSIGELASTVGGNKSYKLGLVNYSFDKDPQSIPVNPSNTFTENFAAVQPTTLTNVKAEGVIILAVDKDNNPMLLKGSDAEDKRNIAGADVFVRLRSGNTYYYQRFNNYSNISNQFLKKPNQQLEVEVKKLLDRAAKYDVKISQRKAADKSFNELVAEP